jgi:hypothetical protein
MPRRTSWPYLVRVACWFLIVLAVGEVSFDRRELLPRPATRTNPGFARDEVKDAFQAGPRKSGRRR